LTRRPTVGLLGLTAPNSDVELAEHHEGYLTQVGRRLAAIADIISGTPSSSHSELTAALTELDRVGVDAIALVMLGPTPPDDCPAALADASAPLLIAGVQPERAVGQDWSEYDLRFNHGIGAAQAIASQCVSAGVDFAALTGDWLSDRFLARFEDWARAAQTLRTLGHDLRGPELLDRAAAILLDQHGLCSMPALDWNRDAILLRPSPGFSAERGPLTAAALTVLPNAELRLVVGSGELLGAADQPQIEQSHLFFAPDAGIESFMDAWLELGSPSECVIAGGDRRERWWRLAELLEIEYEEI
jgi:L-arabinose isomerase